MTKLRTAFRKAVSSSCFAAMDLLTLSYYRFFRQNTLLPILAIANLASTQNRNAELATMLSRWQDRKLHELYFVQVAATLLSAAVIGCFSWEPRDTEHWIGPAAKYCSLVLSLFAILLSASQSFIFTAIIEKRSRADRGVQPQYLARDLDMVCRIMKKSRTLSSAAATPRVWGSFYLTESESGDDNREIGGQKRVPKQLRWGTLPSITVNDNSSDIEVRIRWNMVFTWQAPMMLLAYSVIAFLMGLTVYVCTPLYSEGLRGKEAAIFYLVSLGVGGFCFMWCSFWAYRFVDLDEL
ncbi:hypothetical protein F4781DRAFT_441928 [Annulohypoxylon bovei var. microspora]|nr:hypothetical protein F4781DRAFT_441928 [Annulohypoxylon bovei var. microspora]